MFDGGYSGSSNRLRQTFPINQTQNQWEVQVSTCFYSIYKTDSLIILLKSVSALFPSVNPGSEEDQQQKPSQ